jgi:hypothetical protein
MNLKKTPRKTTDVEVDANPNEVPEKSRQCT